MPYENSTYKEFYIGRHEGHGHCDWNFSYVGADPANHPVRLRLRFDIMDVTGLPSGTIYPALRRLEKESLVRGDWEDTKIALRQERPARRYYKLTRQGKDALISAVERYPLLARLAPEEKVARR